MDGIAFSFAARIHAGQGRSVIYEKYVSKRILPQDNAFNREASGMNGVCSSWCGSVRAFMMSQCSPIDNHT